MDHEPANESRDPLPRHLRELRNNIVERPPSDSPYLSGSPARYIISRDNSHSADSEEKIDEALKNIPDRLERLLLDIAILQYGGYLDNKNENRQLLFSFDSTPSVVTRAIHNKYPANDRNSLSFDLGFDIGLALSALIGNHSDSSQASEFYAGLSAAFIDPHQPEQTVNKEHSRTSTPSQESGVEVDGECLEQYGIQLTDYLSAKVYRYSVQQDLDDEYLNSRKVTEKFLDDYLENWFHKLVTLKIHIEDEWESIDEADVAGMTAKEALTALWELEHHIQSGNKNTSEKIAKTANKTGSYARQVTNVLNRLSTSGKPSSQTTATIEYEDVVRWDNEGEWQLSEYGIMMLYHVFEQNLNSEWIQKIGVNKSIRSSTRQNVGQEEKIVQEAMNSYYKDEK